MPRIYDLKYVNPFIWNALNEVLGDFSRKQLAQTRFTSGQTEPHFTPSFLGLTRSRPLKSAVTVLFNPLPHSPADFCNSVLQREGFETSGPWHFCLSGNPTSRELTNCEVTPVLRQNSMRTENSAIPCHDGCLIQVIPSPSNAKNLCRGTRPVYLYVYKDGV